MWFHFLPLGVGMGESCHVMSSRLTRLFFNLTLFFPSADGILSTFGRNIQHWLEEFPTYSVEHHFEFARVWKLIILYHLSLISKFISLISNQKPVHSICDWGQDCGVSLDETDSIVNLWSLWLIPFKDTQKLRKRVSYTPLTPKQNLSWVHGMFLKHIQGQWKILILLYSLIFVL